MTVTAALAGMATERRGIVGGVTCSNGMTSVARSVHSPSAVRGWSSERIWMGLSGLEKIWVNCRCGTVSISVDLGGSGSMLVDLSKSKSG